MSRNVGIDARVKLPSGRWADQATDLRSANPDDATYLIARFMWTHSTNGKFYGSVGTVMKGIWPDQPNENLRKSAAGALRRNGFVPEQETNGRFGWRVPEVFPTWVSGRPRVDDDGSQTEGGPVSKGQITKTMDALMRAITDKQGETPRDLAAKLGWSSQNVSAVGKTLRDRGWLKAVGSTTAARYYPTDKPFPFRRNGRKTVVVVKDKSVTDAEAVEAAREVGPIGPDNPVRVDPASAEAIEQATGGRVLFDKDGYMLVLKDGKLYKPQMAWTLTPA